MYIYIYIYNPDSANREIRALSFQFQAIPSSLIVRAVGHVVVVVFIAVAAANAKHGRRLALPDLLPTAARPPRRAGGGHGGEGRGSSLQGSSGRGLGPRRRGRSYAGGHRLPSPRPVRAKLMYIQPRSVHLR